MKLPKQITPGLRQQADAARGRVPGMSRQVSASGITPQQESVCQHPATQCSTQCNSGLKQCRLGSVYFKCPC